MGIDPDELMQKLLEGGTTVVKFNNSKNATITKIKEEAIDLPKVPRFPVSPDL